jgi:mannose-1-phosphate guanylyltransferase
MKALLLAAGLGTRLRPLTNNIPKCLVPINNKPLLGYWLEQLNDAGVTEFHINTHYFAPQVEAYLEPLKEKYKIFTHFESTLQGTLKTFQLLKEQLFNDGQAIIVAHADNLVFCHWQKFIEFHQRAPIDVVASMMTFETSTPSSCGIVEIDENKRLIAFHEKVTNPPSNHASGAVFCFNKQVQNIWQVADNCTDISEHLIPLLLGKTQCWHNSQYLKDIGTPEALKQAEQDVLNYV